MHCEGRERQIVVSWVWGVARRCLFFHGYPLKSNIDTKNGNSICKRNHHFGVSMLVFGSVFEFIRGSWPRLLPSSLGLRRTRQQLPTLPPRLLWPFFQQRSFHGFPMGFPMVGGGGAERTSFLQSCFWGEWNKHTWSHMKGMKVKFRRNKKWMFCQHGYVGGNRETSEIFPPQKKSITPFWWGLGWWSLPGSWSLSGFLWCSSRCILRTTWSVPRASFAKLQKGSVAQSCSTKQ